MPQVSDLKIKLQSGSDNLHYASWKFNGTTSTSSSGSLKGGDLVSIKPGATYYNGAHIPDWVKNQKWYLIQVKGDRAVLGYNEARNNNIESAINVANLTGGSGGGSTTVSTDTLDHYSVHWYYDSGDGIWFDGSSEDTTNSYSTYSPPSNAIQVHVVVTPVAKTQTINDTEVAYWTGTAARAYYATACNPPEKPSTPSVTIDKYTLTASLENISDPRTAVMYFEVYNGTTLCGGGNVEVKLGMASMSLTVEAGGEYRVRCRGVNTNYNSWIGGEWSDYTSVVKTIPSAPESITSCKALSETSVYLEWSAVKTAKTYEIQYATKKEYLDSSDAVSSVTGIEFNHYEKTGLETGEEYYFRVRAVNDQGESGWSEVKMVVLGKDPAAPTTWSSSTTVITGEPLNLYWVHNAADGSSQTYAELEIYIGEEKTTYTIKNSRDDDEKDKTSVYEVDTSGYSEGTKVQWRVRTAGVTKAYGDWSVQRTVDIYAPPTLTLSVTDNSGNMLTTLNNFPFYLSALAGPKTQLPIGYHVVITANTGYETVDYIGNAKIINAGDEIYSRYFDTTEQLLIEFSASSLDLEDGIEYTITCTVSMNSGLSTEASTTFNVTWEEVGYEPDASIAVDKDLIVAYITPYCRDNDGAIVDGVLLSVYRKEYDGTYVALGTGIENGKNTVITDPHPALDYARYRIVATTKATGAVRYYDPPGYPVQDKRIIIQWSEEWTNFEGTNSDGFATPVWAGSMLKLPYDIDVSDANTVDVDLINYIGRTYPVSYYGTNISATATWNTNVLKSDAETLYALRRLSIWKGDCYVREPSGSGYWANVSVSFSQKHTEQLVPVTLSITRVSGGI